MKQRDLMKECILTIKENKLIADNVYRLVLSGDISDITVPGQFINIELPGFFLRRPISVCDVSYGNLTEAKGAGAEGAGTVTVLYKEVGNGTELLRTLPEGTRLNTLTGLGNGFDLSLSGERPLLIGGGIGSAPMLMLCKRLIGEGKKPQVVLGFNSAGDVILEGELKRLVGDIDLKIMTADGSCGNKGMVTDGFKDMDYTYFYACGPTPMLKAVYKAAEGDGELSFEERMGCGFGACVGCSTETKSGVRRVCKDGPVFKKGDIIWKD